MTGAGEETRGQHADDAWQDQLADAENENRQARLDQEADDHPIATH